MTRFSKDDRATFTASDNRIKQLKSVGVVVIDAAPARKAASDSSSG